MFRTMFRGVLVVMLIAVTAPVFAQEAEPEIPPEELAEQPAEQVTEKGLVFKDQIVVTPGRQEQASGDAPAPITVFDRETIEKIQPEKMADLFKAIPGVEIEGEGPFRGIPVIRGLSSNRVLILVDGQRLNNARESTSFAGIQPALVNLSEVERIEVLRGPASVQYGSDAIGGVINIITRQPNLGAQDFKVGGDVALEYGTISDSQAGRVSVTGTGSGFSFYAGGSYEKVDDYTAADGASEDERYSRLRAGGQHRPQQRHGADQLQRWIQVPDRAAGRASDRCRGRSHPGRRFPRLLSGDHRHRFHLPELRSRQDRRGLELGPGVGAVRHLAEHLLPGHQQGEREHLRSFPGFVSDTFTQSEIDSIGFNAQSIADAGQHHLTFGLDFYTDNVEDNALSRRPASVRSACRRAPRWRCRRANRRVSAYTSRTGGRSAMRSRCSSGCAATLSALSARTIPTIRVSPST